MWPQTEHPMTGVEECQARALSVQSLSKGLTHPPSLKSRSPPLLRDAPIPTPGLCWWSVCFPNPRAIGGLLKLHPLQGLLIICIINTRSLEICLSTQINPNILEYSGEEATIGEYVGHALAA